MEEGINIVNNLSISYFIPFPPISFIHSNQTQYFIYSQMPLFSALTFGVDSIVGID